MLSYYHYHYHHSKVTFFPLKAPKNTGCARGLCECDLTIANCLKGKKYNKKMKNVDEEKECGVDEDHQNSKKEKKRGEKKQKKKGIRKTA